MRSKRQRSPWAFDDTSELVCPHCGSNRIVRVFDRWALAHGVQIYYCAACNKKFYEREVDDYRPTFRT